MRIHTSQPTNATGLYLRKHRMHGSATAVYRTNIDKPTAGVHLTDAAIRIVLQQLIIDNTSVHNNSAYRATHLRPRCQEALLAAQILDSVEHADSAQLRSHHRDLPYTSPSLTEQTTRRLCTQGLHLCRATRNPHAPAAAAACSGASATPAFRLSSASVRAPPRSTLVRKYSPAR